MKNLKNLIAAVYAPMSEDKSLNLEVIPEYAKFLKSNNIAGTFVNGSTGDFASLTIDERKLIIDAWAQNRLDDLAIINHVGHTSLKGAMELASHSADKVDAISALAPYYFKLPDLQSLVDYCAKIAACAPNQPFYYYHIPDLSGAEFSMIDFLTLANDQIPNLAGIKFTKNNLIDFRYCKKFDKGSKNILFGVDEIFLTSLPLGAKGWVGSTYNHLAPLYYAIKEAFESHDMETAAQLQTKAMIFVDTLNSRGGFNGAGKSFMKILGIDCGPCRFPHKTFSMDELYEIKQILEDLGIMDYMSTRPVSI